MSKSISASLRQLLQKAGDSLAKREASREQLAQWARELGEMSREKANRNFGDQKKDLPKK